MRFALLTLAVLVVGCAVSTTAEEEKDKGGKGKEISLDGLTSTTPGTWVSEEPSNKMRFAQFKLPRAKGDERDGEVVIFKGLGGGTKPNIERWKGQFIPPEGKTIDDVAKVETIKIGTNEATQLDVQGTYKFKNPPFDPNAKEERLPHYRMVAIYFDGPKDVYQIKMTGPSKTLEMYKKGFDEWVKAFK
jgi:hypothetical protein